MNSKKNTDIRVVISYNSKVILKISIYIDFSISLEINFPKFNSLIHFNFNMIIEMTIMSRSCLVLGALTSIIIEKIPMQLMYVLYWI